MPCGGEKGTRIAFTDEMLLSLASMVNRSACSIPKLFEAFVASHGRVSKRQFELKLYQIASKTEAKIWAIRPEYSHLIPSKDVTAMPESLQEKIQTSAAGEDFVAVPPGGHTVERACQ